MAGEDEQGPWNSPTATDEEHGPWDNYGKDTAASGSSDMDIDEYVKRPPTFKYGAEGTDQRPQESLSEYAARRAKEEQNKGTWGRIKESLNPFAGVGEISPLLGAAAESRRRASAGKATAEQTDIAQGKKPPEQLWPGQMRPMPAGTAEDLEARTLQMGSSLTTPSNLAQMGAAVVAPEIMLPKFAIEGAKAMYDPAKEYIQNLREGGDWGNVSPEQAEQFLGGAAELTGAVAGGGELKQRGLIGQSPGARAVNKLVTGRPFTDVGRINEAVRQIVAVKPPGMSEVDYQQRVYQAVQDLQDIAKRSGGKIQTPRDASVEINKRVKELEGPISDHVETFDRPEDMVDPAHWAAAILDRMDKALTKRAGHLNPEEQLKAKTAVMKWLGDQPKSYAELEGNRQRLNQEAEKYYSASPADKHAIDVSDATAVAQRAAADGIRDLLYGPDDPAVPGLLEHSGIQITDNNGNPVNLRAFRQRVGNLIEIRNHFEDAIVRAERSGDWSAFTSLRKGPSLAAGGIGALWGLMTGKVTGLLAGSALGELAKMAQDYRTSRNPNLMIQKSFRNLASTAPYRPPVGGVRPVGLNVRAPGRNMAPGQFPTGQGALPQGAANAPVQGPQLPAGTAPFPISGANQPAVNAGLFQGQPQVGQPPPPGFGGPYTPPEKPTEPIMGEQMPLNLPPEGRGPLFRLPQTPTVPVPPEGPGQYPSGQGAPPAGAVHGPERGLRRNPATGRMEVVPPKTMQTTEAEYLRVGNTFIDDRGDPRRIVEITKSGKIRTADDTPRTYPEGEIQHQGEINSPQSQITRGGKFHPEGEPIEGEEEEPKKKEDERIDLGEIGGKEPEIQIPKTTGATPRSTERDLAEYITLIERNGGDEEVARDHWDGLDEDQRQDALDEQRDIAQRRPPRTEGPQSVEDALAALHQRAEEFPAWFDHLPPGAMTPEQFGYFGGPSFMLDDGSTIQGGPNIMSHMQLARQIGYSLLNDANAIRLAGTDAYETHAMPSDAQLTHLKRLFDESGGKTVSWSLYPEEEKNYSDDADWNLASNGEGSFSQFRRALDEQYGGFRPGDLHASTRVPGAVGAEDAHTKPMFLDWSSINYGDLPERLLNAVKNFPDIKGMFSKEELKNPKEALNKYVDHLADNLVWLYKKIPKELRDITRMWYESVNRMTKEDHEEFGYTPLQSSGVIAVLSPMTDWFMNRSMSKRIQSIYRNQQAARWTPEMEAKARELAFTETRLKVQNAIKKLKKADARGLTPEVIEKAQTFAERNQRKAAFDLLNKATKSDLTIPDKTVEPLLSRIKGKKLSELSDPYDAGGWIRIYDETYNNPAYQEIAPDGTILGNFKNKDGTEARMGWQSFDAIEKAVNILRDGSRENVSRQLGNEHKVRNFHNNIIDTFSPRGDLTADTHAVAAAHLSPFSAKSPQVQRNFGGPPSSDPMGVYGTYVLNSEAYRRATARVNAELGENIRPNQMQSISWEGIRDLFPDTFKTAENKTKIENIWKAHRRGKITLDEARNQVLATAGGVKIPDWFERWKALKEAQE